LVTLTSIVRRRAWLGGWILLLGVLFAQQQSAPAQAPDTPHRSAETVDWPETTQTARPWTRWWWHGSAVDPSNLTELLEKYRDAGLGGVEITCIYGVQDNQARNRQYLSDEWVQAVQHVLREAGRLDLGVDLPAGSGWRMGGPSVTPEDANSKLVLEKQQVSNTEPFTKQFGRATPQAVVAYNRSGERLDLSRHLADGGVTCQLPSGDWTVYTAAYRWAGDRVKRPGPGGAGLNINPFSKRSVDKFLDHFGKILDRLPGIRAQFHDSFEYEGDWQPQFFEEFAARRGYRLEEHLPALAGDGPRDQVGRVKCDYRETLADMVLENLVEPWVAWAHAHGQLARNQSHGSPANWLDLYAACDIPETESFGRLHGDDADRLVLKFASSAAHVAGRRLVSAESATWLDEHFNVTLAQVKQIVDRQIMAGVNHVFYHGTAYSPRDAAWPGWLFYASTQLNPQNPIWRDLPALNSYLTRCQSVLQASQPDNDVLLYWPLHDAWHKPEGLRMEVRVHNGHEWFYGRPLGNAAQLLESAGYAFDYVSDRGLASCKPGEAGKIQAPGGAYQAVVVPQAQHMPRATLFKLAELAQAGAKIIFWGDLPQSPPGMAGARPDPAWDDTCERLRADHGAGTVLTGADLMANLRAAGIRCESALTDRGLVFLRKRWEGDVLYFIKNETEAELDEPIVLSARSHSALLLDPMSGQIGLGQVGVDASGGSAVRLQLAPGQTMLVRASADSLSAPPWPYREQAAEAVVLPGPWRVEFLAGGPTLPAGYDTTQPAPWTEAPDPTAQSFAGTVRYSTPWKVPAENGTRWLLDLGDVLGSARVRLNGSEVATLVAPPFNVEVSGLPSSENLLEIEVTGVAANRIRDLDRRGVAWRIFEDINLVNIDYKQFDASVWPVRPLGLRGPITATPLAPTPKPASGVP
jgi:hypothetical protein